MIFIFQKLIEFYNSTIFREIRNNLLIYWAISIKLISLKKSNFKNSNFFDGNFQLLVKKLFQRQKEHFDRICCFCQCFNSRCQCQVTISDNITTFKRRTSFFIQVNTARYGSSIPLFKFEDITNSKWVRLLRYGRIFFNFLAACAVSGTPFLMNSTFFNLWFIFFSK